MYLSRVILDDSNRKVIEGIVRPSLFHGAIEWSTGKERMRNVWRIDHLQGKNCILIATQEVPDLVDFQRQFGLKDEEPLTKSYDTFLQSLQSGQQWRFRVKINPVKVREGKRYPVLNKDLYAWFSEKALSAGMDINTESLNIMEIKDYNFYKDVSMRSQRGRYVRFKAVTFEGVMKITDANRVRHALTSGIGKEKAYGCGMLTLARLQ